MKKVFLMLAVAFSMTMFSCSNNAEKADATVEEEPAVVEEVTEEVPVEVVDSANQVVAEGVVEATEGEVVAAPAAE